MDEKLESPLHNVKESIFGSGHLLLFSDKNYMENAFKMPHNYIFNCSSVARVPERVQSQPD